MILAAAALVAVITDRPEIRLQGAEIRLGDVAELQDEARRLAGMVIARLPDGEAKAELSRETLALLARRAVPGLAVNAGGGSVVLAHPTPLRPVELQCLEAGNAVPDGSEVLPADAVQTECNAARPAARLRFDPATGTVIAAAPIRVGDYLGAARLAPKPAVARGDKLSLRSRSGPVKIEREVVAMQPARTPGGKLFVRDAEGQVFASPLQVETGR